jgi:hypothetical protein
MRTSCIQLDTDAIDATHHNVIERSLQCTLIDIVLVLTNTDRLRMIFTSSARFWCKLERLGFRR